MSNRQEKARRREARLAAERADARGAARTTKLTWAASILAGLAAIALIVVVVGSRNDRATVAAPAAAAAPATTTGGVPRQIAANAKQANQVVDGSIRDKLAQLKGVPVVVNQWASWCPNCKQEFPYFERLARRYERRVAFVGLDSQDERGDAEAFLQGFPVSYPSIYDASAEQARSIGGGQGWPTTFFYDRTGRQTFVRQGGYTSLESLQADIQRYALGSRS